MQLDAFITSLAIERAGAYASALEARGFHGLWVTETQVDPLLPLAVAATATRSLRLGTGITVALARSPMVVAMDAWAIQRASRGRLDLGLGTQVRAHIERRFAMPYGEPAKRIREYVAALRHIWGAFQGEHRLSFKGDHYRFDLMSPFFDPGPIEHPRIPIYLAAVNAGMFRVAGEIADGIEAHPFSTPSYLREVALPAIGKGLARGGRGRSAITIACPVFTLVEASPTYGADESYVRGQIAFYASTPTYRAVLTHHGWDATGEELSRLARAGRFDDLPGLVGAEMLDAFATRAPTYAELGQRLRERYAGVLDRAGLYGDAAKIGADDVAALRAGLARARD
ncbi:MAG TPA: TIGR03617 family F420-dependent LLM class oxidoreductase [Candidatus Limnocylindria bacterium]|nr:TIGR03617 family F420-dependent LLM class oxidoreductase [Candidatus Limnocylindria bacterium]